VLKGVDWPKISQVPNLADMSKTGGSSTASLAWEEPFVEEESGILAGEVGGRGGRSRNVVGRGWKVGDRRGIGGPKRVERGQGRLRKLKRERPREVDGGGRSSEEERSSESAGRACAV